MSFCKNCGNQILDNSKFCAKCGKPIISAQNTTWRQNSTNNQQYQHPNFNTQNTYAPAGGSDYQMNQQSDLTLLKTLSGKIKTEATIWFAIACLQVLIGFCYIFLELTDDIFSGVIILIIAVINFTVSTQDFKYAKQILVNPVGIVKKFQPIGAIIVTLIYNLLFGGIIGVVGSIFGFITRSFVMNNIQAFQNIEKQHTVHVQQ